MRFRRITSISVVSLVFVFGGAGSAFADEEVGGFLYLDDGQYDPAIGYADAFVKTTGMRETRITTFPNSIEGCTGLDWPTSPFLDSSTGDIYWTYEWYEDATDPFYAGWSIDEEDSTARLMRFDGESCQTAASIPQATGGAEFASFVDFDSSTRRAAFARRLDTGVASDASSTVAVFGIDSGDLSTYFMSWDSNPYQERWLDIMHVQLEGNTVWVGGVSDTDPSGDVYTVAEYDLDGVANGSWVYPEWTRNFKVGNGFFYPENYMVVIDDSIFMTVDVCLWRVSISNPVNWPSPGVPYDFLNETGSQDSCWWYYQEPIGSPTVVHPGEQLMSIDKGADGLLYFSTISDWAIITSTGFDQIVAKESIHIRRLDDPDRGEFQDSKIVFETSVDPDYSLIGFSTFSLSSTTSGGSTVRTEWQTKYIEVPVEIKVPVYFPSAKSLESEEMCVPTIRDDSVAPLSRGYAQLSEAPQTKENPAWFEPRSSLVGAATGLGISLVGAAGYRALNALRHIRLSK